jgi:excisionase family DNA binding protein
MRAGTAKMFIATQGEQLLSTGEAATILGTSRQHVVNLCTSGKLPHSWVGKHRRVRQADVNRIAAGSHRTTKDQSRSLVLAHATAGMIVADPDRALELARKNMKRMRDGAARGAALVWLDEWSELLDGPLVDLLSALTSASPRSRELRQNNPFAGLLTDEARVRALRAAKR